MLDIRVFSDTVKIGLEIYYDIVILLLYGKEGFYDRQKNF